MKYTLPRTRARRTRVEYDREFLDELLKTALSKGGDEAEVFLENSSITSIRADDQRIRGIQQGIYAGAGIRIITGTNYLYVYTSNPDIPRLRELALGAAEAVRIGRRGSAAPLGDLLQDSLHAPQMDPSGIPLEDKTALLLRADHSAREYSPLIHDVMVNYGDWDQGVTIARSDGTYCQDRRVRTRFSVTAEAQQGERRENGSWNPGLAMGSEFFDLIPPETVAREAARSACALMDADYAPQGSMPVVLAHEFGGVIFHEACGHALESTSTAKGVSPFSEKMGKRIASAKVSAFDDGTMDHGWGSSAFDDEGVKTSRTRLIHRGKLESFMVDRIGSRQLDHPLTGNGRRASYRFPPASRMTNTFIQPGKKTPEEIIASVERGLYCRKMGGGSVNTATTEFNFAVHEAYLIIDGKIDRPIRGASLIGTGRDVLRRIEEVGNDLELGAGMCGSVSGSLPAAVGQPTLLVSSLVVGGRS